MADGIFVPPHLQIDPLRPVQFFTQGASTGVQAGEARNRAQQAAAALAQRAQESAAQQQIAEMRALSDAAQFSAQLTLTREENQRKAAAAARQYEAAENIRRAIASGVPPEQAFFQNPQFFVESPGALANIQPPFNPRVVDVDGNKLIQVSPNTYQRLPPPPQSGPIKAETVVNEKGEPIGYGIPNPNTGTVSPFTTQEGKITPKDSRKVTLWNQEANMLRRQIYDMESNFTKDIFPETYEKAKNRLGVLDGKIRGVMGEGLAPERPYARGSARPLDEFGDQGPERAAVEAEARELMKKYPTKADAIRKRFVELYGSDL